MQADPAKSPKIPLHNGINYLYDITRLRTGEHCKIKMKSSSPVVAIPLKAEVHKQLTRMKELRCVLCMHTIIYDNLDITIQKWNTYFVLHVWEEDIPNDGDNVYVQHSVWCRNKIEVDGLSRWPDAPIKLKTISKNWTYWIVKTWISKVSIPNFCQFIPMKQIQSVKAAIQLVVPFMRFHIQYVVKSPITP